jgi:hypothetical protein
MSLLCTDCNASYDLSLQEQNILEKCGLRVGEVFFPFPPPPQCPFCRLQRLLACVNERHLYHRTCDGTGRQIVSNYSSDKQFTVYEPNYWFSDQWDPLSYGREFDFSKPFFEQFAALLAVVPRMGLDQGVHMENSAFNNYCDGLKDCYCNSNAVDLEQVHYSNTIFNCRDALDCTLCVRCERCSQLVHCTQCYNVHFAVDTEQSHDSYFLQNCRDVSECLFCVNLRQRQFCIRNIQYTKEEYFARKAEFLRRLEEEENGLETLQREWLAFCSDQIVPPTMNRHCENATGEYLMHCANVERTYIGLNSQDISHCYSITASKDCVSTYGDGMELGYYLFAGSGSYNCALTVVAWDHCRDVFYSDYCFASTKDVFGCVGLKRKSHCILNKQYSQEAYEELVQKIIAHMRATGEWGAFFPATLAPFAYNESVAENFFPLQREEALARGWTWKEEETHGSETNPGADANVRICRKTGKPFRIIPQEREFYRRHHLPLPLLCPEERYRSRIAQMSPLRQWERRCMNPKRRETGSPCDHTFLTSHSPEKPARVYCEECYLAEVY